MGRHASVVDQDIQTAQLAHGGFHQMTTLLLVSDVCGHDEGASSHGHAVRCHSLQPRSISRGQYQHGLQAVASRQLTCQLGAYAVRCASDDDVGHLETHPQLIGHAFRKIRLQIKAKDPSQDTAGNQPQNQRQSAVHAAWGTRAIAASRTGRLIRVANALKAMVMNQTWS